METRIKIAVCDDEEKERQLLGRYIEEWAKERNTAAEVRCFESAESFFFSWEDEREYRLLILDIEMQKMNGMELARKVRETDDKLPILFVTGYDEYMQYGYDVSALHYLIKPINKEKFFSLLDKLPKEQPAAEKIWLEAEGGNISVTLDAIWYVEAYGHRCILHLQDNAYELKESISAFEARVAGQEAIVKCHRSYLVNLAHIAAVWKEEILMDNQERLPLSRSMRKKVNDIFVGYYRKGEK